MCEEDNISRCLFQVALLKSVETDVCSHFMVHAGHAPIFECSL